ncbi:PREDICTED: uncharacterized protein LOC107067685 [Polistes dominula]|uniref:Uncharacterized protein LOC107067685 n=1 Tax=Polistes dominula TaxID=743375 RepID=A0ABM1IFB5_POLDO|nr:PREDICTED: uncharacterized protein LOC107067685 [Polistes dominula]XP_015178902.1 PREDICTED: uncharacterized protein LOC107067685 [Polistes dominula]
MNKDPRSTEYRKPRKFYGTPINKYINKAILISSGFLFVFGCCLSPILSPVLQRVADKFRFIPNKTIIGPDSIEWSLEQKLRERLKIREEIAEHNQQQIDREVPT